MRIDKVIESAHPAGQAGFASDADFLRRSYLVLTGTIPSSAQARAFFADTAPDKRARVVEQLLGSHEFVRWMAVQLDVMLMERRAEKHVKAPGWRQFLEDSVAANKPWDQLVSELFSVDGADEKTRPLARWVLEREGDPHALTRDVGRIFLGRDTACAQCHDHPRIDDYVQRDYYGLEAFFCRTYLFQPDPNKPGLLGEKAEGEATFTSVFTKVGGTTLPRMPGGAEIAEKPVAPGEMWAVAPNDKDKNVRPVPKFSRRGELAAALTANPAFRRNIANRLWQMAFGRGLVEPVDLDHSANPPSNPELLNLLADAIGAMKFDTKAFLRELALTQAFQRSLDLPEPTPDAARVAAERCQPLEQDAKALAAVASDSEETWRKARETILQAQRSAEPLSAEAKKQEAAVAEAKKQADAATTEAKKAAEALAAKQDVQKTLSEAAAKANEAVAKLPEVAELAQAAKTFQAKATSAANELTPLEQTASAKKADAETKGKAVIAAQESATAARAKADEATRGIAALQQTLDVAAAQKQSDRVKSIQAARLASEVKAVSTWASASAEERSARETLERAEATFTATNQKLSQLTAQANTAPAQLAAVEEAANAAAAQSSRSNETLAQRRPAGALLAEATAKAAEAAAKVPKDAEVQAAAAAIKAKADAVIAEVNALERASSEATAKAEAAKKLAADTRAEMEKARADLTATQQQLAVAESAVKAAREKAVTTTQPAAQAREALSKAWTESFAAANLVPLTPEQLCWSVMQATGILDHLRREAEAEWDKKNPRSDAEKADPAKQAERTVAVEKAFRNKLRPYEDQFVRSFGGAAGQPQTEFFATPEQALYFENGGALRGWSGALAGRVAALPEPRAMAEELYLSTLTRMPAGDEVAELTSALAAQPEKKNETLTNLAWALITSTEFRFIR